MNLMIQLLIIGAGEAGKTVASQINSHKRLKAKYRIVGFVDDNPDKKEIQGYPVLGEISRVQFLCRKFSINEVIIAIPSATKKELEIILSHLNAGETVIKIVPCIHDIIEGKFRFEQVRDIEAADLLGREEVGFSENELKEFYRGKRVLITGAGGSIGSEILRQLIALPVENITALGHGENSVYDLIKEFQHHEAFDFVIGDIRDRDKLSYEFKRSRPDIIFHAAAHKHVPLMERFPDEAVKNNILGTWNCAMAAIEAGVSRFNLVSTDKAVNPASVMGTTKRIAEKIVLSLNHIQNTTRFTFTRFGNVLGSNGSVVPLFKTQIDQGGPLTITHKDMTRYFMSIREAARLVVKSGTLKEGDVFILKMGEPMRIQDLARQMVALAGYEEGDIPVVYTGLRPGEKLFEELLTDSEELVDTCYERLMVSGEGESFYSEEEMTALIENIKQAASSYNGEIIRSCLQKYIEEYEYTWEQ